MCPQQNVLFQHLTVAEHLELYAAIKGVPDSLIASEIREMVKKVELADKSSALASTLSGGMKRKLQVEAWPEIEWLCLRLRVLVYWSHFAPTYRMCLTGSSRHDWGFKGRLSRRANLWHGPPC